MKYFGFDGIRDKFGEFSNTSDILSGLVSAFTHAIAMHL
jgi:hypothetical protein